MPMCANLLKIYQIYCIFSEHIFLRTHLKGCSCTVKRAFYHETSYIAILIQTIISKSQRKVITNQKKMIKIEQPVTPTGGFL